MGILMMHFKIRISLFILFVVCLGTNRLGAQNPMVNSLPNFNLDEIVVFTPYVFENEKEEKKYQQLEADLRVVYPLIKIVSVEYERINKEMEFYGPDQEKEYLKWCEKYIRENYMSKLSGLKVRQGRLLLRLIDRQLGITPYGLIKNYRNGFRAFVWQGTAHLFFSNLKTEYDEDENPMIEHIMRKIEAEDSIGSP
jgi:hypothetical protein